MLALLMARNELSTSCSACERTRYGMVWQGFRHSPALASSPGGGGGAGADMASASTTFCIAKARHAPFCLTQTSRKKLLLALLLPLLLALLLAWADIRWPVTAATRP